MELSTFAGAAIAAVIAASQPAQAQYTQGYEAAPVVTQATYYNAHYNNHHRIPLPRIIKKLRYKGFYGFQGAKWTDRGYKIKARGPRGKLVKITVNAYTGRIIEIRPVQPRYPYGGGYGGGKGGGYGGGHGSGHGGGYGGGHGGSGYGSSYGGGNGSVSFGVWRY